MQPEAYSDASPFRRELKRLAAEGNLNAAQLAYAAPHKPLEELYDTRVDPHQIHNLAGELSHRVALEKMRRAIRDWLLKSCDAGFLTELQMWERIGSTGTVYELAHNKSEYALSELLNAAELVGRPQAMPRQLELLRNADDGVRYWAAVGLHAACKNGGGAPTALRDALKDPSPVVRIEAAAALSELEETAEPLQVLEKELRSPRLDVVLHAARALELLGGRAQPLGLRCARCLNACDAKRRTQETRPCSYVSAWSRHCLSDPIG